MPLYEYICEQCDFTFEVLIRLDDPNPPCTLCGGGTRRALSTPGGFVMKGEGGVSRFRSSHSACGTCSGCSDPKRCCEK